MSDKTTDRTGDGTAGKPTDRPTDKTADKTTGRAGGNSTICGRLRAVREKVFGPRGRAGFARALGLSPSTYIYYEKGRVPPPEILARAAEVAAVSLPWLVTGEGSPEVPAGDLRRQWADKLPADLQASLDRLAEQSPPGDLSPAASNALAEILEQVARRFPRRQPVAWQKARCERAEDMIPILGRTAAGLVGTYEELLGEEPQTTVADIARKALGLDIRRQTAVEIASDKPRIGHSPEKLAQTISLVQLNDPLPSGVVEFIDAALIRRTYPTAFAMRVDGESMSPRFHQGDVVIALAGGVIGQGQAGLIKIRGRVGVTLKLVRREGDTVHLIPINETYDTERLSESDIEWTASVLLAARFAPDR